MLHDNPYRQQLVLLIAGVLTGIAMSIHLWIPHRMFPLFPVIEMPPLIQYAGCLMLFTGSLGLVIPRFSSRVIGSLTVIGLLLLLLSDQMRWQPWAYQYFLMLLPILWMRGNSNNADVLHIHRIVLIGIYLWGGLHKFSHGFISVYQNSMVEPITSSMSDGIFKNLINNSAYIVAPFEVLIAVGLCFGKTRRLAAIGAIGTHLLILALLSPLVKDGFSNTVVWPWNIVMMLMVVNLFWNDGLGQSLFQSNLRIPALAISTLVLVLPAFFYLGAWDRYLSFNLYSGKQQRMYVYIPESHLDRVPEYLTDHMKDVEGSAAKVISISTWSMNELNVPFVSETRNSMAMTKHICQELRGVPFVFYVDYKHLPDKGDLQFKCGEQRRLKSF